MSRFKRRKPSRTRQQITKPWDWQEQAVSAQESAQPELEAPTTSGQVPGEDFSRLTVSQLEERIAAEGLTLPEEGSGSGGAVVKRDLVALLEGHFGS